MFLNFSLYKHDDKPKYIFFSNFIIHILNSDILISILYKTTFQTQNNCIYVILQPLIEHKQF